ncbi:MAG: lytic transglycosylase domain-containing protein [Lysobacteraceae bacterium]|nr:MAG: lytic transglycosylase domain-containing protein [Xanthomonadaceae bacterium]
MPRARDIAALSLACMATMSCGAADARTVYRCVRGNAVSLATAPEPGSKCEAKTIDDNAAMLPNLWGNLGVFSGTLYEWKAPDGSILYTTRRLPGAVQYLKFKVATPAASPAHEGLGKLGTPRLDAYAKEFRKAAKARKVDDAFLRAIAHAESGFDATAVSPKGAQGLMQLMPEVQRDYGVADPFVPAQSIDAAARHLHALLRRYAGNHALAAAAYNAGIGAVGKYGGVPPYAETIAYVAKVQALHARYRKAMKLPPLDPPLRAAE